MKSFLHLNDDKNNICLSLLTATSAVLDYNQKRYLVVGMCLHSVISPALRKYVVPILTALYEELILKENIDTQTYSAHLKKYQPTSTKLNYKAVNNNETVHGKANYDYKIKSFVDLSKLFLLPHMAHYKGFDETCDSSALLTLIIMIDDKFSPALKSGAEDVRVVSIKTDILPCMSPSLFKKEESKF